jgi:hypothetical protein
VDFSKPIVYNSLSVNTATRSAGGLPTVGYLVEQFRPLPPAIDAYFEKRALTDGMDAGDVYLAGRQFGLIVTVFGSTQGDFWDRAQDLFYAFSPTIAYATDSANAGFLPLDFYQPTADIATWPTSAYPSGIPLRYYVRPMHAPIYLVERDKDGGTVSRGFSKRFEINLQARDPRKYLQSTIAATVTSTTQTAVYKGDYESFPVFSWSMSAAGSSAFQLTLNSTNLTINLASISTGSLSYDFGAGTLIDQSGASKLGQVTIIDPYPKVRTGSTFRFLNGTGVSGCTMTYREAFT